MGSTHDGEILQGVLPESFRQQNSVFCNSDEIKGTTYRSDVCVIFGVDEYGLPRFGKIQFVVVNAQEEACLVLKEFRTLFYSIHLHGYCLEKSDETMCILQNDLLDPWPVLLSTCAGEIYAALHHSL